MYMRTRSPLNIVREDQEPSVIVSGDQRGLRALCSIVSEDQGGLGALCSIVSGNQRGSERGAHGLGRFREVREVRELRELQEPRT